MVKVYTSQTQTITGLKTFEAYINADGGILLGGSINCSDNTIVNCGGLDMDGVIDMNGYNIGSGGDRAGTIYANYFNGNGASVTDVNADKVDGRHMYTLHGTEVNLPTASSVGWNIPGMDDVPDNICVASFYSNINYTELSGIFTDISGSTWCYRILNSSGGTVTVRPMFIQSKN